MVTQLQSSAQKDIIYPDSDGQPMADNTQQFELIVWIKENLELSESQLQIDRPDSQLFLTYLELEQQLQQERQRAQQAEARAEQTEALLEQERHKA